MARGTPPRPTGGAGRPQPARRVGPQRTGKSAQPPRPGGAAGKRAAGKQAAPPSRSVLRTQQVDQQRRLAAARTTNQEQHRLRQHQFLREAMAQQGEAEAEQRTAAVQERVAQLESILATGLRRSARIDLAALPQPLPDPPFDPGPLGAPVPEPVWADFAPSRHRSAWWGGAWTAARAERQEAAAQEAFAQARTRWQAAEQARLAQLAEQEQAHQAAVAGQREQVTRYNDRIARVAAGMRDRESAVVASFLRTVLGRMPLPAGFPRRWEVTHQPEPERLALRLVLPDPSMVPPVTGYTYHAPADEVRPVARPRAECRQLYLEVVAQVTLLAVRDVFEADPELAHLSYTGLVDRLGPDDPPEFACLLQLAVTREAFGELDLEGEPAVESLGRVGARISPDPYALIPVDPQSADAEQELRHPGHPPHGDRAGQEGQAGQ